MPGIFYPSAPADSLQRLEYPIIGGSRNTGIITPSTHEYYTATDRKKPLSLKGSLRQKEKNLHPRRVVFFPFCPCFFPSSSGIVIRVSGNNKQPARSIANRQTSALPELSANLQLITFSHRQRNHQTREENICQWRIPQNPGACDFTIDKYFLSGTLFQAGGVIKKAGKTPSK